jgi:competence ComEA-like helix-hairpin-helix protein
MTLPTPATMGSDTSRILALFLSLLAVFSVFACAKRSRPASTLTPAPSVAEQSATSRQININTASAKELETLPGIGEALAERIVAHRKNYGPFRRTEHLMMVRGISEARFRALRDLVTVE